MIRTNELGQPIGEPVPGWAATAASAARADDRPVLPPRAARPGAARGRSVRGQCAPTPTGGIWTYLPYGPFARLADYRDWASDGAAARTRCSTPSSTSASGKAVGVASYLRIEPADGSIEVGHIDYSPAPAAHAGGHRGDVPDDAPGVRRARLPPLRVEVRRAQRAVAGRGRSGWASASRACSGRPTMYKGRNRDTAWYSVIDSEWPAREAAFEAGSTRRTSTGDGRQRRPLARPPA